MCTGTIAALGPGWPLHSWPRSDLLALAGVVATVVVAVVPPLRRGVLGGWRSALLRAGFPRLKYARWFVATWGVYENPYLDDKESLNLSNTYVPLSFRTEEENRESLSTAFAVLDNWKTGNLVIEGAPGCGKSTLLKAYGVGVAQSKGISSGDVVPFLIQLRKLARYDNQQIGIANYLVDEILVSSVGMKIEQARQFLQYSLNKRRVLVMLDGLDEVTASRYPLILEAVYRFTKDHQPDCPSWRARIIVTCRRQNFLGLSNEWIPAIAQTACLLAPLRNSEIFNYLDKLRPKFRASDGPESFIQAVRASGTLDLHRVPLVLAMSVGLYARKDYYEVPSSIARLYQAMIEEMLDRHRFKSDPGGAAVAFQLADKYRFLREFALNSACSNQGFDEFTRSDLVGFAISLAPNLNAVTDPKAFLEEIIQRSGLLTDVGEGDRYIFAHRSIQEFLAAEELRLTDGKFLLARANNQEWRQVIQFYAAGLEQRQANVFLTDLSQHNHELAGHCLAVANMSNDPAAAILDALQPVDGTRLAALAAATMSSRRPVQQMAINRLEETLSRPDNSLSALSGEINAMLPLLNSLAGTNAARIAGLVPQIIEHVPDDPRLVEPLWRCLAAPGIESLPACRTIILRLLTLATSTDGFAELARQEPYTRSFITADLRDRAYPFRNALSRDHNLITLLAWAEYLKVTPDEPNRYFQAKIAGCLDRVEIGRKRAIIISPYWPSLFFSIMVASASIITTAAIVITHPKWLLHPFGPWTLLLVLLAAVTPIGIFLLYVNSLAKRLPENSRAAYYLGTKEKHVDTAHIMFLGDIIPALTDTAPVLLSVMIVPLTIAAALEPLMTGSVILYFVLTISAGLCYWITSLDFFSRGRRYYLYSPNPYIDMYDDSKSRDWISTPPL